MGFEDYLYQKASRLLDNAHYESNKPLPKAGTKAYKRNVEAVKYLSAHRLFLTALETPAQGFDQSTDLIAETAFANIPKEVRQSTLHKAFQIAIENDNDKALSWVLDHSFEVLAMSKSTRMELDSFKQLPDVNTESFRPTSIIGSWSSLATRRDAHKCLKILADKGIYEQEMNILFPTEKVERKFFSLFETYSYYIHPLAIYAASWGGGVRSYTEGRRNAETENILFSSPIHKYVQSALNFIALQYPSRLSHNLMSSTFELTKENIPEIVTNAYDTFGMNKDSSYRATIKSLNKVFRQSEDTMRQVFSDELFKQSFSFFNPRNQDLGDILIFLEKSLNPKKNGLTLPSPSTDTVKCAYEIIQQEILETQVKTNLTEYQQALRQLSSLLSPLITPPKQKKRI